MEKGWQKVINRGLSLSYLKNYSLSLASIETLSNPKRYTLTNGRLTIAHTIYEDAGVYTCIANNIVGNSQATVTVTIRGKIENIIS